MAPRALNEEDTALDSRKQILKQYIDACELIKETERDIERLRKKQKTVLTDKVQASNPEYPYQPISVTIEGNPHLWDADAAITERLRLLEVRRAQCKAYKVEAERIMNTLPPRITRIVRFRYFTGETWEQVAAEIGRGATGNSIRMELNRFFDGEEF